MNLIIDSYIRLLTYHDYHINFITKNALNRCMKPKIQRLISKLSTASDLNQQDSSDKQFQSMPLSAQIYPTDDQTHPRWTETPATTDESAMLQYTLALSMSEQGSLPPPPPSTQQTIKFVDNDDETPTVVDECDDDHVSESSSTTNEDNTQTNNNTNNTTSTPILPSNDSTIKLNINESIDSELYEQCLYDLKHLIVEKLLDNRDEYLLHNTQLNGLNSIDYLQLLLTLTIEFASKSDENNQQFVLIYIKKFVKTNDIFKR